MASSLHVGFDRLGKHHRGARPISAETARFHDGDLEAERLNLQSQRFCRFQLKRGLAADDFLLGVCDLVEKPLNRNGIVRAERSHQAAG
jgi:hypothetical protein